jgi:hypothetical protein
MATNLDPNFDPWSETIPLAERLAREELQQGWRGWLREGVELGQLLLRLPSQLDRVLTGLDRGNLVIQTNLAPGARRTIKGLEQAVNRLGWTVAAVGLLLAGVQLHNGDSSLGVWLMGAALAAFLWGWLGQR